MAQARLGRYELVEELGRGAMGTVYRAHDPRLDRTVALKAIRFDPNSIEQQEFRDRFRAEAKSAGRLSHPNIVTIHDFGEIEDTAYIAMEFLQGETLRHLMQRQRISVKRAARYATQIADGLAAAHIEGVVHRDIKPANIVRLPNGVLKITDFGIAQLPTSHLTHAGTVIGTPKYMSPEQAKGMRVDGRADVFALGVILYEMLTGKTPFAGATMTSVMYQVVHEQPIHPAKWNKELPAPLSAIIARCLAKDPNERYQSAADLARDLRNFEEPGAGITGPADVFLPFEGLKTPAEERDATERTVPFGAMRAGGATASATTAAQPGQRQRTFTWRHGVAIAAVAIVGFSIALYYLVATSRPNPSITATDNATPVTAPPPVVIASPAPLAAPTAAVPAAEPVPEPLKADTLSTDANPSLKMTPDAKLELAKKSAARKKPPASGATPAPVEPAPIAVARPPAAAPVVRAPVVVPASPEPTGFSGFLKQQHDCIVDGKCAPHPDPNEIRN